MLPILGGVVVFAVLALALLAERSFEGGRRLPRPRRRRRALPRQDETTLPRLPR